MQLAVPQVKELRVLVKYSSRGRLGAPRPFLPLPESGHLVILPIGAPLNFSHTPALRGNATSLSLRTVKSSWNKKFCICTPSDVRSADLPVWRPAGSCWLACSTAQSVSTPFSYGMSTHSQTAIESPCSGVILPVSGPWCDTRPQRCRVRATRRSRQVSICATSDTTGCAGAT